MKFIFAVSTVLAVAVAKPSGLLAPGLAVATPWAVSPPIVAEASSQFHAQDDIGQYTYGYSNPLSAKSEARSADGLTRGGYQYVDADGKIQSVEYSSDAAHGFRVAASNLPVAPAVPEVPALPQPLPVQDTPEVAAAKASHLAALEEAKVRASQEDAVTPAANLESATAVAVKSSVVAAPTVAAIATPAVALGPEVHGYSFSINSVSSPALAEVKTAAVPAFTSRVSLPFPVPASVVIPAVTSTLSGNAVGAVAPAVSPIPATSGFSYSVRTVGPAVAAAPAVATAPALAPKIAEPIPVAVETVAPNAVTKIAAPAVAATSAVSANSASSISSYSVNTVHPSQLLPAPSLAAKTAAPVVAAPSLAVNSFGPVVAAAPAVGTIAAGPLVTLTPATSSYSTYSINPLAGPAVAISPPVASTIVRSAPSVAAVRTILPSVPNTIASLWAAQRFPPILLAENTPTSEVKVSKH